MKRKIILFLSAGLMVLQSPNFIWAEELSSGEVWQEQETNKEMQEDVLSSGEAEVSEEKDDILFQTDEYLPEEGMQSKTSSIKIDSTHFPDKCFQEYVRKQFDTNKDGTLSLEEIDAAVTIEIGQSGLRSVRGIEYFSKLQELKVYGGELANLDVRKNKKLKKLSCTSVRIKDLKVAGLSELEEITADGNYMTELELSGLKRLRKLSVNMCNMKEMDLTGLQNLETVECSYGQLTSLKVKGLKKLKTLYCHNNLLRELDVTGADNLLVLVCNGNYMSGIDKVKGANQELLDALGDTFMFLPQKVVQKTVLSGVYNSASGILLKWKESEGAKEYGVFRRDADGKWERIGTVIDEKPSISPDYKSKTFSFMDTSVKEKNGNSYTYTVRAFNNGMQSDYDSKGRTITRLMTPALSNVYNSRKGALVKWKKVNNAEGYHIFRKPINGGWKKIADVTGENTISYIDTEVANEYGKTYCYTVKAYKGKDSSAYNGVGKTLFRLEAPEFTAHKNMTGRKIEVEWSGVPQADGYEVQYSTSGTFSWNRSVIINGSSIQKQRLYNLTKGKQYYVRIRSYKKTEKGMSYSTWNTVNQIVSK